MAAPSEAETGDAVLRVPEIFSPVISVVNDTVGGKKFGQLCERTLAKLPWPNSETLFSADELLKLKAAFGLDSEQQLAKVVALALNLCQQIAYYTIRPDDLPEALKVCGFSAEIADGFQDVWARVGADVISKLKTCSDSPNQLTDIKWSVNVDVSSRDQGKIMEPIACLQLALSGDKRPVKKHPVSSGVRENTQADSGDKRLNLELNHEQLFRLYDDLERIQAHIDSFLK